MRETSERNIMEDQIAERDHVYLQYLCHKSALKRERPATSDEIESAKSWFRSHPTWTPPDIAILLN